MDALNLTGRRTGTPRFRPAAVPRRACAEPPHADTPIIAYWDARAQGYSRTVLEELGGAQHDVWGHVMDTRTRHARMAARKAGRTPRALDLGCGPGFFSILLAQLGCAVDAVDSSKQMLVQAQLNARGAGAAHIAFSEGDVTRLPFPDGAFDIIVSRNVTWLMRDPVAAYREWRRVLAPGGILLVFDANWYRYLADPLVDAQRIVDQAGTSARSLGEDYLATAEQQDRCERIALELPLTYEERPSWDVRVLRELGFSRVVVDEGIWRTVWTADEQAFYASSPLFLIEAVK